MAAHPSVLAWRIPGTGEPGGLPSMGSHRVGHDWSALAAAAAAAEPLKASSCLWMEMWDRRAVVKGYKSFPRWVGSWKWMFGSHEGRVWTSWPQVFWTWSEHHCLFLDTVHSSGVVPPLFRSYGPQVAGWAILTLQQSQGLSCCSFLGFLGTLHWCCIVLPS